MPPPSVQLRKDDLNRFYTRGSVGELLAAELSDVRPDRVLDLGAGEGALVSSILRRWPNTDVVSVDLDQDVASGLRRALAEAGAGQHRHHTHNVLDPTLPELLDLGAFDLAVCNPPFYRPRWESGFGRILEAACLEVACRPADATAEVLFLAQNLRLLRDGGRLALIAPDGLITGARLSNFRRELLRAHRVDKVIQLPRHSFHDTEARCFILYLTKGLGETSRVELVRFDAETGVSAPIFVDSNDAAKRLDFDFHSRRSGGQHFLTLRDLDADVRRGSIDSVRRRGVRYPVFHTTDYGDLRQGAVKFEPTSERPECGKIVVAEPGDILIARVDRRLHEKVGIVRNGTAALTDCVYRVRVPAAFRERVFQALRSEVGVQALLAATKGVSARLLGKQDLLDLALPI